MAASNSSRVTNRYASSGSPGRWSRVVQERLSHRRSSRASSRSTMVPLPTPPGPEMTMIRGLRAGRGERLEQLLALVGAEALDAPGLAHLALLQEATGLD